jgi:hypothetical protein
LWIWGMCLLGVTGPFLSRLVGSEIASGGGKGKHHGRGFAIFTLLFVLLYDCGRGVLHERSVAVLSSRLYEGSAPRRVFAGPDAANPLRWRGVVETDSAYVVQDINLAAADPMAERSQVFHKPDGDAALEAARRAPAIRGFLEFAQYPLWRVTPWPDVENGRLVEVFDMRFGSPASPGFMASAVLNGRNEVVQSEFQFGTPRGR